jgi:hypothetical protein
MRQLRVGLIAVAVIGGGWYGVRYFLPLGVSSDFQVICSAYEAGMNKVRQAQIDSQQPNEPEIAMEIASAIEKSVVNKDVTSSIRGIGMASLDQKYELLRTAASELGIKNWECEAAREYFSRDVKAH